jgi:hypothetical protein
MPRTKLDPLYAEITEKNHFVKSFMDALNSTRGRDRQNYGDFCKRIGISHGTLARWNNGLLDGAEIGNVLTAAYRAGYRLKLEPIKEDKL